ncbi:hypothetical protein D3C85_1567840 [compost metagenome]
MIADRIILRFYKGRDAFVKAVHITRELIALGLVLELGGNLRLGAVVAWLNRISERYRRNQEKQRKKLGHSFLTKSRQLARSLAWLASFSCMVNWPEYLR